MTWNFEKKIIIKGSQEKLWTILSNVPKWSDWDVDVATSKIDTQPETTLEGATGTLQMKFNQTFKFQIKNLQPFSRFQYFVDFPGMRSEWYFHSDALNDGSGTFELRSGLRANGFATFFYRFLLQSRLDPAFDACNSNLKKLVEE